MANRSLRDDTPSSEMLSKDQLVSKASMSITHRIHEAGIVEWLNTNLPLTGTTRNYDNST